jgi:hypothetical protein
MKIRQLSGRTFERLDNREEALDVAIIDRKLAKRVFGQENPLGADLLVDHFNEKTFSLERLPVRIVGVVDNVRSASLAAESRETIYVSASGCSGDRSRRRAAAADRAGAA